MMLSKVEFNAASKILGQSTLSGDYSGFYICKRSKEKHIRFSFGWNSQDAYFIYLTGWMGYQLEMKQIITATCKCFLANIK